MKASPAGVSQPDNDGTDAGAVLPGCEAHYAAAGRLAKRAGSAHRRQSETRNGPEPDGRDRRREQRHQQTGGWLNSTLENERLFTADVAHELRTPLAGVRLHLELLAQSEKINVDPLIARLDQMMDSVSHLLQLARVGQSFSAGNYQTVMLNRDVIMPLHDALKEMAATRGQTLVVHALSQDSAVRGDATLLRVMLRNLVENAHRYSPENSTLTVTALAGEEPVLMVEDEGVGIDESRAEKLSEAFVRMDSRYGGLGLGLSIVSRICLLHHARFTLQNRQNRSGTRACVVFEGSE